MRDNVPGEFSMLSYNVEGIVSKLGDSSFVSFLTNYDFVCLVETFVDTFTSTFFPSYTSFVAPAKKLSHHGRKSGGVIVLVRNVFLRFVKQVEVKYDNVIVLEVAKELLGSDSNVFLVNAYLNPKNSPFYDICEYDNGIAMLEQCLLDIVEKHEDASFILCGDLNARTANNIPSYFDFSPLGFDAVANNLGPDGITDHDLPFQRCSQDIHKNVYGQYLLGLCSTFELYILNGTGGGDTTGRYTYISSVGSSVIDYFIFSRSLCFLPCEMHVQERIDSKHMPITCTVRCQKRLSHPKEDDTPLCKFKWSDDQCDSFMQNLNAPENLAEIERAKNLIDVNMNEAVRVFTAALSSVASCLTKNQSGKKLFSNEWFDKECKEKRRLVRKALRTFLRSRRISDRDCYCELRKQYKQLLVTKEKDYKLKCRKELESNVRNSTKFWGTIKKFRTKTRQVNDISDDQWLEHFKKVFDANTVEQEADVEIIFSTIAPSDQNSSMEDDILNSDITFQEVTESILHLKANKAAGADGIIPEIFKQSSGKITPFLVHLFNTVFSSGQYPEAWTEAIIHPLHKKGNIHEPDNYRGISLLNVCSKLYSYIINKRLTRWVEDNDVLGDIQAGFRKDHSTIDHIFTLLSMIQRHLLRNRKLYVAFIDFRKAFDFISHCKLWPILYKTGIRGKMLQTIQSMYNIVKARVRNGSNLTDAFFCRKGLKQGEITSPLLFSLFINELAMDIIKYGRHGVQLLPDLVELFILLFADDIVLLSDTIVGLQNQLNVLARNCAELDLHVNLEKSNIVIFRNGGYISKKEIWCYNGQNVAIVNSYKYLGFFLTTRITFSTALEEMANKARKGVTDIFRTLWRLGDFSATIFLKLFDAQIKPMLLYGSEIWGLNQHKSVENVHTFALKKLLNVSPRTPNDMAYGETGRYPLYICSFTSCIKFWLRLTRMDSSRLPRKAYNMLLSLHNSGKFCWASRVHRTLYTFGFGFVWENQGVQIPNAFINMFKQRLIDCHSQNWHEHVNSSNRFCVYRLFKMSISLEPYFAAVTNKHIRDVLIRFRIGASKIRTHKLRYVAHTPEDLMCPLCNAVCENEMHTLFFCNSLNDLREKYIPRKYVVHPSYVTLRLLMRDETCLHDLGRFIYHSNKRRDACLCPE